jgi:hypothetical protein
MHQLTGVCVGEDGMELSFADFMRSVPLFHALSVAELCELEEKCTIEVGAVAISVLFFALMMCVMITSPSRIERTSSLRARGRTWCM